MKTFVEKYVSEISMTELDCEYPYYTDKNQEDPNEVMMSRKDREEMCWAEIDSMDIDEAIKVLEQLKEDGAERVTFATHTDHHGYYFYGTKLIEI